MKFNKFLKSKNACEDGLDWVGTKTIEEAYIQCERGDWLLWFATRVGVDRIVMLRVCLECAKLVENLMTDERSLNALVVIDRFLNGDATEKELSDAAKAADSAAATYAAYAVADAAYADADTTHIAYYVAEAAASAAYAAADAAATAAADAARKDTLKKCADIARNHISLEIIKKNMEAGND